MAGGSKSSRKAVKKEKSVAATSHHQKEAPANEESWQPSIIKKEQIQELVRMGFLAEDLISLWKVPSRDATFPSEGTREVTIFCRYLEVGFGLPTHDFLCGVLNYYGIQTAHLSLNSYLHIAIFMHMCEAFLGIDSHFELFLNLFHLKSVPKDDEPKYISGAALQIKQGM